MNTQHTPGPWTAVNVLHKNTATYCRIDGANGKPVGFAGVYKKPVTRETEANAKLIAAAPDCYKSALINFSVLTTAYQYIKCTNGIAEMPEYQRLLAELEESIAITKAAIAKATGE